MIDCLMPIQMPKEELSEAERQRSANLGPSLSGSDASLIEWRLGMTQRLVILGIACLTAIPSVSPAQGFLKTETKTPAGKVKSEVIAYAPREGDLVFYDDRNPAWMA